MTRAKNIASIKKWCAVLLVATSLFSCKKWDDYKQYTATGETLYTGKLDSAKVFSGKNRVRITGWLSADPKLQQLKVYWNGKADSALFPINGITGLTLFDQIINNVSEGIKTFTIVTSDNVGNKSVDVNVSGVSYGQNYRKRLANRSIGGMVFSPAGTTINWEPMDLITGAQYTEIEYEVGGVAKKVVTPATDNSSMLDGLTVTTPIRYRTIFKPEPTSIDTFSVPFQERLVKIVPQLKNRQVPFVAASRQGRWGTLADWKSNNNVKIHAGGHGGWDEWNGNIFNVESGWGAPPVNNGKIWQTLTLEAGTYTFEISNLMNTNLTVNDKAYIVVAKGNELPDTDQVGTAIGSVQIVDGKAVSVYKIKFTLTEKTDVSMGYLTTQPDGNPGRFCNIRAFDFYEN